MQRAFVQNGVERCVLLKTSRKKYSNCLIVGLEKTETPKSGIASKDMMGTFAEIFPTVRKIQVLDLGSVMVAVYEASIDAPCICVWNEKKWQSFGYVGSIGASTSNHLHFEVMFIECR